MKNKINLLLTAIFLTVILIGCGKENPVGNTEKQKVTGDNYINCTVEKKDYQLSLNFDCDSMVYLHTKNSICVYSNNEVDTIQLTDFVNISVKIK